MDIHHMAFMALKENLRSELLAKRTSLTTTEIQEKSALLCQHLISSPLFQRANTILWYAAHQQEVDLSPAIHHAFHHGKMAIFPAVVHPGPTSGSPPTLLLRQISSYPQDLHPGYAGIPEPGNDFPSVFPKTIDLALIPGVGFDIFGHRLGRGKGHYDRLLRSIPGKKIGICYQFQIQPRIPNEEQDVAMDYLLTEQGVTKCIVDEI